MNETWRKRCIFGLLVVTVIWGYFALIAPKDETTLVTPPEAAVTTPVQPVAIAKPEISDSLIAIYRLSVWGNDPFYRDPSPVIADPTKNVPALHLLGILYRQTGAQALINGRIAKEGDIVDGYRIVSINREN
ncbi:MAG: hypothetical protein PHR28_04735, partial [candidate division Zixibacteria bacterium]|nr:hypothetical protein [candidate division Zixibacteria bacterium]